MKRNLLKQIRNEWRDNVWMIIELAIVSAAIWFVLTVLYLLTNGLFMPKGFDTDDVYSISVKYIDKSSPAFQGDENDEYKNAQQDLMDILRRLRENPNVEAVAIHHNALPYNFNYQGVPVERFDEKDSLSFQANVRYGSPDIVKVVKYHSLTGMDENKLVEALGRGEILLSDNDTYENAESLKGQRVILGGDSSQVFKVADVIQKVRRNDYEDSWGGTAIIPMDESKELTYEIALRVKPGRGPQFEEDMHNDKTLSRQRNVYLTDVKRMSDVREGNQRRTDSYVRLFVTIIFFLLVTIFLGLLGTFWFRMQQRVSEIAIRKVCGATNGDIFRRIIAEGLILLFAAVAFISVLIWPFIGDLMNDAGLEWWKLLVIEGITVLIVAAGIVLSLWWPARKAMGIEPAIAIKDE